jgi:CRP/FNR family transcriptional regulator, cyclic AMP receptor protein
MPLFEGVPERLLLLAAEAVRPQQYAAGQVILQQGAPGEALLLMGLGAVRVSRVDAAGRERVMNDAYAPAVLGETALLTGGERSASVTALGEVGAWLLYRDDFVRLSNLAPRLLWNLARLLAERVTAQSDELIAVGVSTELNMVQVFLGLYRQRQVAGEAHPERLPLGRSDLTLRLSSSRETVVRLLRRLEQARLISVRSGEVTLCDPVGLEALLYDIAAEEH